MCVFSLANFRALLTPVQMDVSQLERCKRGALNAAEELAFELRASELRERLLEMQVGIYRPMFGTSTHPLGVD
jgi:hypothetical protein